MILNFLACSKSSLGETPWGQTAQDEFQKMIKDKDPVIVDFTATWCGPCKMIGPKFVEIAKTCQKLKFIKVDVDEAEDIAAGCEISAMPTFQVYKDGEKVDEMVGADKDKLRELCMKFDK